MSLQKLPRGPRYPACTGAGHDREHGRMKPSSSPLWGPRYLRHFQWRRTLKFATLTWGTRGDVQPFVALGAELSRRGHRAVIAAKAPFRSLVEDHGIEFFE